MAKNNDTCIVSFTQTAKFYSKELIRLINRHATPEQLFRVTKILEREANLIAKDSQAMTDAKAYLVTRTLFGGNYE